MVKIPFSKFSLARNIFFSGISGGILVGLSLLATIVNHGLNWDQMKVVAGMLLPGLPLAALGFINLHRLVTCAKAVVANQNGVIVATTFLDRSASWQEIENIKVEAHVEWIRLRSYRHMTV